MILGIRKWKWQKEQNGMINCLRFLDIIRLIRLIWSNLRFNLPINQICELNHNFNSFVPCNVIVRCTQRSFPESWIIHIKNYTLSFDLKSDFKFDLKTMWNTFSVCHTCTRSISLAPHSVLNAFKIDIKSNLIFDLKFNLVTINSALRFYKFENFNHRFRFRGARNL